MKAWELRVRRDDFAATDLVDVDVPELGPGEALLRVDRVGVTANNVTYAVVGDSMNYWSFFPTAEGWGRVPLWGFADVIASNAEGVEAGTRVYGYLPTSSHLIVRPDRVDAAGFRDASEHRADLPRPYNVYATTTGDPAYEADREDLQILYRPLFITSFMLDDFLADHEFFKAETTVMSSASSKTAYGTAFCMRLRGFGPRLVGLTSERNLEFTQSLGCYEDVFSYDQIDALSSDRPVLYVDFSGDAPLREKLHALFGDSLVYDAVVGVTHLDAQERSGETLPGPAPTFFFAPDQIRKRRADWGPGEIEKRHAESWREFAPVVEEWVDVEVSEGPEGLKAAWLEVLSGRSDPRTGNVVTL